MRIYNINSPNLLAKLLLFHNLLSWKIFKTLPILVQIKDKEIQASEIWIVIMISLWSRWCRSVVLAKQIKRILLDKHHQHLRIKRILKGHQESLAKKIPLKEDENLIAIKVSSNSNNNYNQQLNLLLQMLHSKKNLKKINSLLKILKTNLFLKTINFIRNNSQKTLQCLWNNNKKSKIFMKSCKLIHK